MSGIREQHEDLMATSAFISDALTMFESMRRRVYDHIGFDYQLVLPGTTPRGSDLLWCTLLSTCLRCNGQHTSQPKSSYIMWQGYVPFQCEHGGAITRMYVEPEGRQPGQADYRMPGVVRPVTPADASSTSGGEVTISKLKKDIKRVESRRDEALKHLRAWAHQAEMRPPPEYFPELAKVEIDKKIARVDKWSDDMLDTIESLIESMERASTEYEFEAPRVSGAEPADHSTPQRDGLPTDSRGNVLQPPKLPDNLRQQLVDRGAQLNNQGFLGVGEDSVQELEVSELGGQGQPVSVPQIVEGDRVEVSGAGGA